MNRRRFISTALVGSTAAALTAARTATAWQAPDRFIRPDAASDEGGLWSMMDREETRLRRSPFSVKDAELRDYIQRIACRLAGDHCADLRVHIVQNRTFNAMMAPNGLMQVWTGLLLRVENEAQLATVLGHEIGHYLERHSLARLRDVKTRSAFAQFLGAFGIVGLVGQLGVIASMFAYSRDNERDADRIGVQLMRDAGYDASEASRVWSNLLVEVRANPEHDPAKASPFFASHPSMDERRETLDALAASMPGGAINEQ
jgi:predicted Zn-dependent protease